MRVVDLTAGGLSDAEVAEVVFLTVEVVETEVFGRDEARVDAGFGAVEDVVVVDGFLANPTLGAAVDFTSTLGATLATPFAAGALMGAGDLVDAAGDLETAGDFLTVDRELALDLDTGVAAFLAEVADFLGSTRDSVALATSTTFSMTTGSGMITAG
jgi:hypothetical protein